MFQTMGYIERPLSGWGGRIKGGGGKQSKEILKGKERRKTEHGKQVIEKDNPQFYRPEISLNFVDYERI